MRRSATTALLALLCVTACEAEYPDGRFSCATVTDCPRGWVCEQRATQTGPRCYRTTQDAGNTPTGCVAAGVPVTCDDGIACTIDDCDNPTRRCTHTPPDADDDGHADALCLDAEGVPLGDDCDDADPRRYPGNPEVCDAEGVDEDCDPTTIGFKDDDGDGSIDAMCCNTDADRVTHCGLDCDDENVAVHAYQPEFCDGIDNDCDGEIDEVQNALPWYADEDMDGFGAGDPVITSCTSQPGRSLLDNDCDDTDSQVSPGQPEVCDGIDNNCNGVVDERLVDCDTSPEPDAPLPVNECVTGLSDCADIATCRDTATAFLCICPTGYTGDGRGSGGCADEDDCLTDNGGCDTNPIATCENQPGAPRTCACPALYAGTGIGPDGCVEGDPCLVENGGCDSDSMATCRWTPGTSPRCECPPFYVNATEDSTRCVDRNECDDNNGGCGSSTLYRCTNNDGAAPTCEELDVCGINNGGCDTSPMAACVQDGANIRCTCPSGSFGEGAGTSGCTPCTPVANCASGLTCTSASNQVCGTCAPGYVGDGTGICTACGAGTYDNNNACVDCGTVANCASVETCNGTNGTGVVCPTCALGYNGSGTSVCTTCTAIANCASGLTCTNTTDQTCGTCAPGYVGDATGTCTPCGAGTYDSNNICVVCGTIAACVATEACNPTSGADLICPSCAPGYTGSGTAACTDINECLSSNGGCDMSPMALCTNIPGSRTCTCPGDYVGTGIGDDGCASIQRGTTPTTQSASTTGPYRVASYTSGYRNGPHFGAATIYRPTNANPPFAMVAIVSGLPSSQSSIAAWGPFLASHGIVTMTVDANSGGSGGGGSGATLRAVALMDALVSLRGEHTRRRSPLNGELDLDRAAIMGWALGGGGAWIASSNNPELHASISLCGTLSGAALTASNITVPTLLLAGASDTSASEQSQSVYDAIADTTSKMIYAVMGADQSAASNPANQSGAIGRYGLSWLKVFLEGDARYRTLLLAAAPNASDFRRNLN